MFTFSDSSTKRLKECDIRLQAIHNLGIRHAPYDYAITEGYRSREDQDEAFFTGKSDARAGQSKHNVGHLAHPNSQATDIYIYHDGVYWDGTEKGKAGRQSRQMFRELMRYLQGVAVGLGHELNVMPELRGGLLDIGHMELV